MSRKVLLHILGWTLAFGATPAEAAVTISGIDERTAVATNLRLLQAQLPEIQSNYLRLSKVATDAQTRLDNANRRVALEAEGDTAGLNALPTDTPTVADATEALNRARQELAPAEARYQRIVLQIAGLEARRAQLEASGNPIVVNPTQINIVNNNRQPPNNGGAPNGGAPPSLGGTPPGGGGGGEMGGSGGSSGQSPAAKNDGGAGLQTSNTPGNGAAKVESPSPAAVQTAQAVPASKPNLGTMSTPRQQTATTVPTGTAMNKALGILNVRGRSTPTMVVASTGRARVSGRSSGGSVRLVAMLAATASDSGGEKPARKVYVDASPAPAVESTEPAPRRFMDLPPGGGGGGGRGADEIRAVAEGGHRRR